MGYKIIIKIVTLFIIIVTGSTSFGAGYKMKEKDYVNLYCDGQTEYILPDKTRVDCLTNEYAIEFDWAKKWAESIGQSLYYSKKTGKKPAVAIIISNPSDYRYIQRIKDTDENITIFEIPSCDYKNY